MVHFPFPKFYAKLASAVLHSTSQFSYRTLILNQFGFGSRRKCKSFGLNNCTPNLGLVTNIMLVCSSVTSPKLVFFQSGDVPFETTFMEIFKVSSLVAIQLGSL